jgi:hypothetical protein
MGHGEPSSEHLATKDAPMSSEAHDVLAQQVNDAFETLNTRSATNDQDAASETAPSFQFHAVSPDPSAQPSQDHTGVSRKSPLRPAPSRPASRRTRQRAGSQANGTIQQPPFVGALPGFGSPPLESSPEGRCVLLSGDIPGCFCAPSRCIYTASPRLVQWLIFLLLLGNFAMISACV